MDENSGSDPNAPLLAKDDQKSADYGGRRRRLIRRYSVNSLRSEFVRKLPDKLRSCLDSESLFDIDLSRTTGLSKGFFLSLSVSLSHMCLCLRSTA